MSESIKIDILLPGQRAEAVVRETARFTERTDRYSLREEGEDVTGNYRIYIERDGLFMEVRRANLHGYEDGTVVRFRVQPDRIDDTTSLDEGTDVAAVIEAVKDVYQLIDDVPAMGVGFDQYQPEAAPLDGDEFPPAQRKFISWLDVYSPKEVERIGRDRLLSAPAHRTDELDDGSVLVLSKHPCTQESLDEVSDHIGITSWENLPEFV